MSTIRLSDTLSDGAPSLFYTEGFQVMIENHVVPGPDEVRGRDKHALRRRGHQAVLHREL